MRRGVGFLRRVLLLLVIFIEVLGFGAEVVGKGEAGDDVESGGSKWRLELC